MKETVDQKRELAKQVTEELLLHVRSGRHAEATKVFADNCISDSNPDGIFIGPASDYIMDGKIDESHALKLRKITLLAIEKRANKMQNVMKPDWEMELQHKLEQSQKETDKAFIIVNFGKTSVKMKIDALFQ